MKKIITVLASITLLFSCIVFVRATDTQSTMVRYSVNPTVIYIEYDGTRTTQKVEAGKTLKEPEHKGIAGYTFLGWKVLSTGEFWDFQNKVEDNLTLLACYNQNEAQDNQCSGQVRLGAGTFSIDIRVENGVSGVEIGTDKQKLLEALIQSGDITGEELAQISEGAAMEFVLLVKDGDTLISEEAKEQMEKQANGYTIGQYLDISLFKQITNNGKTLKNQQMHQIPDEITVIIQIPDHLLNTDKTVQRTYCVLRSHNGKVEILDSDYDAESHTLTFRTNQFSDYAIAYKDIRNATSETNEGIRTQSENQNIKASPQTGDTTDISIYLICMVCAIAIIKIHWRRS